MIHTLIRKKVNNTRNKTHGNVFAIAFVTNSTYTFPHDSTRISEIKDTVTEILWKERERELRSKRKNSDEFESSF